MHLLCKTLQSWVEGTMYVTSAMVGYSY